jgi:hypothetical protein
LEWFLTKSCEPNSVISLYTSNNHTKLLFIKLLWVLNTQETSLMKVSNDVWNVQKTPALKGPWGLQNPSKFGLQCCFGAVIQLLLLRNRLYKVGVFLKMAFRKSSGRDNLKIYSFSKSVKKFSPSLVCNHKWDNEESTSHITHLSIVIDERRWVTHWRKYELKEHHQLGYQILWEVAQKLN